MPDYDKTVIDELEFAMGTRKRRRKSKADTEQDRTSKPKLIILRPADCSAIAPQDYVLKGLIVAGNLVVLYGPPGAGKSLVAPLIGYMVALGQPVFGRRARQGRVIYLAAEDGKGMVGRVQALCEIFGDAPDFILIPQKIDLMDPQEIDLDLILDEVKKEKPALIVLDTLARAFPGLQENESEGMDHVVSVGRDLADATGAAVVIVHHPAKNGGDTPRGHGRLEADADVTMRVEGEGSEDRTVRLGKNRNGSSEASFTFSLHVHHLGIDEDGDIITAAVAVPCGRQPDPGDKSRKLPDGQRVCLEMLERAIIDRGERPPRSDNVPVDVPAVRIETWRSYSYAGEIATSDKPDAKRKAFNRASKSLQVRRIIGVWNGWVWLAVKPSGTSGTHSAFEDVPLDVPPDT